MTTNTSIPDWCIFRGDTGENDRQGFHERLNQLPPPPPWRDFNNNLEQDRGRQFQVEKEEIEKINAALYLRRPLLITGKPGTGKTSLVYAVAKELGLGPVLRWSITSRTTLKDGLYHYDAIARLQASQDRKQHQPGDDENSADKEEIQDIGPYLSLGPLGTAFFAHEHETKDDVHYYPRVLLIDEIDKSDIDLPNDLLHVFEEGYFEIPELIRLKDKQSTAKIRSWGRNAKYETIEDGVVSCKAFPLVVMTSNGEREFPAAFLRRCLQLEMQRPDRDKLNDIVTAHLAAAQEQELEQYKTKKQRETQKAELEEQIQTLLTEFFNRREGHTDKGKQDLATDQLLNAIYLAINRVDPHEGMAPQNKDSLIDSLWRSLSGN